jgi:hypothetical protein
MANRHLDRAAANEGAGAGIASPERGILTDFVVSVPRRFDEPRQHARHVPCS